MFELRMSSLTWSQIQTAQYHPKACSQCTLTASVEDKLILHGGLAEDDGFTVDQTVMPITLNDTWIMDLTSHSWKQFPSRKALPRRWHTGSTGLNNSVIIIGGSERHLTSHNIVFKVMLRCKSLKQVAMQAIFKYRKELPLNHLPGKLLSLLDISTKDQNVCS